MPKKKLKVAVIAPPWLKLYPGCFYGIENVVQNLAARLHELGHHVELFTVKGSTTQVDKIHWYHEKEQYPHIHRPYYEVSTILISHLLYSLNIIRQAGDFDIIHDHTSFIGPAVFAYATGLPPVLHTLHEPFTDPRKLAMGVPDNRLMYDQFKKMRNLYFSAVSQTQKNQAPEGLIPRINVIHNGLNPEEYVYSDKKENYFTIVASMSPDKGQATAARLCDELGIELRMAGTIGGEISTAEQMRATMADKTSHLHNDRMFSYFRDEVAPYIQKGHVKYIGKVSGDDQKQLFARAKAFIFPIDWEEPFGMAVIEALASGTPVLAYRRGAMSEIIEHGVNGFLADNYEELREYAQRVDEINPADCRRSVEEHFSTDHMTNEMVDLYYKVIRDHGRLRTRLNNLELLPKLPTKQAYPQLSSLLPSYPKEGTFYIRPHKG